MCVYIWHLPFSCFLQVMNMYGDLVMDSVPEKVRSPVEVQIKATRGTL